MTFSWLKTQKAWFLTFILVISACVGWVILLHCNISERYRHVPKSYLRRFGERFVSDLVEYNTSVPYDDSSAKSLYQNVRVACWILTAPENLYKRAIAVKNTWTKRCNFVLFMSSVSDPTFPSIGLNVSEGKNHLTAKSMKAFKYLYDHHMNDADWFLKADDDTYVIVENLRYFLSNEDPNEPLLFGHHYKSHRGQHFQSGGAGYVISKEALGRFGAQGFNNSKLCRPDFGGEDVEIGKCLLLLGVKIRSSLDNKRRHRFNCYNYQIMLDSAFIKVYTEVFNVEKIGGGMANLSDYAISFHYVQPKQMYTLEYFIYHLKPYGIIPLLQDLNVHSVNVTFP